MQGRPPGRQGTSFNIKQKMDFFYRAGALLKMHNAALATADLSVRLSVCPSVTFRCFVRRNEDTIMHLCVSTTMTSFWRDIRSVVDHPLRGR